MTTTVNILWELSQALGLSAFYVLTYLIRTIPPSRKYTPAMPSQRPREMQWLSRVTELVRGTIRVHTAF